jgi:hypothetical protein
MAQYIEKSALLAEIERLVNNYDKAIGWIEEINNHHHIMRYSDCCEPTISELTEWFKNYMKGE